MAHHEARCIFIHTLYDEFVAGLYAATPGLAEAAFAEQKQALVRSRFGDSDFYSRNLAAQGFAADDIYFNCAPLQQRWAQENGAAGSGLDILAAQLRRFEPDVVYVHDVGLCDGGFLAAVRPLARLLAGQTAYPLAAGARLADLDFLVSSLPNYVRRFRAQGLSAYHQPLAFDPVVEQSLPDAPRDVPVSFVGSFSPRHAAANALFELLAKETPIIFRGCGASDLPADSPIRSRHRGEAWGLDMFSFLRRSRLTLNRHIDIAEGFANNMRLFEATGCGALLLTDARDNLGDLFRVGEEVLAYASPEDCLAQARRCLEHPEEAAAVAAAGRARTLRDHTYARRMEQTAEILARRLKRLDTRAFFSLPAPDSISVGHTDIAAHEITPALVSGWRDPAIPARQRGLVEDELERMHAGAPPAVYNVMADCLGPIVSHHSRVLEVGCASGYYAEVIEYLTGKRVRYVGVDYSWPLARLAGELHPRKAFCLADGAALPFVDRAFDVAVSSCVLLHVADYPGHLREAARVARERVVLHRTPLRRAGATRIMKKRAYGVETVEFVFNEQELLDLLAREGFLPERTVEYAAHPADDLYEASIVFAASPARSLP